MSNRCTEFCAKLAIAGFGLTLLIAAVLMHDWWINTTGLLIVALRCLADNS